MYIIAVSYTHLPCLLDFTFISQERYSSNEPYEDTGERGMCQISVKNNINSEYVIVKDVYKRQSFDDVFSSFLDALSDMDSSSEEFANNFEKYMQLSLIHIYDTASYSFLHLKTLYGIGHTNFFIFDVHFNNRVNADIICVHSA